jgi:hypothetical protein
VSRDRKFDTQILSTHPARAAGAWPLTPFVAMCSADPLMFVTHYQTASWTPMDVIGLGRAYG